MILLLVVLQQVKVYANNALFAVFLRAAHLYLCFLDPQAQFVDTHIGKSRGQLIEIKAAFVRADRFGPKFATERQRKKNLFETMTRLGQVLFVVAVGS